MGRGRGKGRKPASMTTREDLGIGDEEKIQPNRRRGRPTKAQLRAEMEEQEEALEKIELDEEENGESKKDQALAENGQKRKRSSPMKENLDSVKEENGGGKEIQINGSVASNGFRQNGSRRKNKPRRAAEIQDLSCTALTRNGLVDIYAFNGLISK